MLGVLTFVTYDFATYLTHRLSHEVPVLWAFHRVHHSAEVLNPFTLMRRHPAYDLLSDGLDFVIVGALGGVVLYFWVPEVAIATATVVGSCNALFSCLAANLRHSHVWLAFGPRVSRVFMSPAGHQIHHSKAPQHWDKNFGEVFALWDWMFGTLYVAGREPEAIQFGVAGAEEKHTTLLRAYFVPFANCARIVRDSVRRLQTRYA